MAMKRPVNVLSPIALLAVIVMGAAPSSKKAADAEVPVTAQPTATAATPSAEMLHPESELDLNLNITSNPELPAQPEAAASAATYEIDWYSINGGGTVDAASTNYRMGASIGQSVAGAASSANYNMGIGFWYGAGGGSCACDCHNDPVCDAVISNVQDVVATINVAFRGFAALIDPNANCPYEQSDVNCDTFTSVLDVVLVVNVAFRGFNPATTYCVACP
jgi:hypothetical protein